MSKRWRRRVLFFVILAIILGAGFLIYQYAQPIFRAMEDPARVRAWAESHGPAGAVVFIGGMALQVIVAAIPAGPMEIASGFAYGPIEGAVFSTIGILLGSSLVFALVRRFGSRVILFFFSANRLEEVHIFQNEKRLARLTFLLFLVPGAPKDLLTYLLGLTPMPMAQFLTITTLARIPSTLVSTFGGDALLNKDFGQAAILFAIVSVFSVLGYIGYFRFNEYKKRKSKCP